MARFSRIIPLALMGCLIGSMVLRSTSSLTNADTFFHLRIGEDFLHEWTPWSPGHLNRFASASWAPTQWLSQVVMGWFATRFGLAGVAWLSGLWFVILSLVVYLVCRRRATPLVAAVVTILATFACSAGLSARPQVLSYILMAITVDAWLRTAEDGRARWWLVPMAWIWAMLHGMWILGVVTAAVGAGAVVMERRRSSPRRILLIPVGMAVAGALTPAGPALYRSVFLVGSRSSMFDEWKPPDYTNPFVAVLGVMLGLTVILALRAQSRPWVTTAFIALACAWGIYVQRTVPVSAVTIAPLLAAELRPFVGEGDAVRAERWWLGGFAALGLGVLLLTAPAAGQIHQPAWVGRAIPALPAGTAVIADWAPAGYLVWAYPNVAPVMTGYADMYTDAELRHFTQMMDLAPRWDRQVGAYGARVALLDPKLPLAYALRIQLRWTVVHRSPQVEMLVAPAGAPS